ncbi:MAG: DegQ family serine endoprotease [Acidobacteria bacterium]|nr:DegQ family serine endoprotease [Acidobacteriota bacterium]
MSLVSKLKTRWVVALGSLVLLGAGVVAGAAISNRWDFLPFSRAASANERTSTIPLYISKEPPLGGTISLNEGLAPVVKAVRDGVVNISSTKVTRTTHPNVPFFHDPFFDRFFGQGQNRERTPKEREFRQTSLGSGVVVSPEGYILTNNHVVEGASELKVSFADKREMMARIIGTDKESDLAVIKVEGQGLPGVPMGDSNKTQVGDFVLAIGNPFGLDNSITFGIISATGRGNLNITPFGDFIQTDAAINPGNSGGALVNMRGELIGINTAIFTRGAERGNQGVGFAIPISMARQVMDQLLTQGKVVRGYLGLLPQDMTPALAEEFNLPKNLQGALVSSVEAGTPAEQAGIRRNDVITEFNGEKINNAFQFRMMVSQTAPGSRVDMKLLRQGKPTMVAAVLKERPSTEEAAAEEDLGSDNPLGALDVEDLTPTSLRQLRLPAETTGVVITQVGPGSRAAEAGLQSGDVIQEINHQPVANLQDYKRMAARVGTKRVLLLVNQRNITRYVVIEGRAQN